VVHDLFQAVRQGQCVQGSQPLQVLQRVPGGGRTRRLRRENATLRMEREILKKAAAFFAKETS